MCERELRLVLLWHFGTTDPEEIHNQMQVSLGSEELPYEEMLKRAERLAGPPPRDSIGRICGDQS